MNELRELPLRSLVSALNARQTSSVEVCRAYLDRLSEAESLNAVVFVDEDSVMKEAAAADELRAQGHEAMFLGVPFSVKDSIAVAGWPWRSGSYARADVIAERDATVVAKLRSVGAIPLCKTATPEYTWSAQTHSALHGRTNNPYDLERSPGGSSGGEAAIHAIHGAPFGLGTDGFTSIRVPAHFCGSVGLRPTSGIVSEAGTWPSTKQTGMHDISTTGPMGRYAEDLDLVLEVISGVDVDDPFVHPLDSKRTPLDSGDLTVGVLPSLAGCTPGTQAAISSAAEILEERGARVVELDAWKIDEAVTLAFALMAPDGGARARKNVETAQGRHTTEFTELLASLEVGRTDIDGYLASLERLARYRSTIRRAIAKVDVALVPVASGPAPLHDRLPGDDSEDYDVNGFAHGFAIALAGIPSAVVPVAMEGLLPVGVQFVGSAHEDYRILEIASIVQQSSSSRVSSPHGWEL